jgi:hypothetical protein
MELPPIIVPKITLARLGCNPARVKIERRCIPIACIVGIATGTKQIPATNTAKIFTAIVGEFYAINVMTQTGYTASVLYLPTGYHNAMVTRLKYKSPLGFAYQFDAVPADNPAGYAYKGVSVS